MKTYHIEVIGSNKIWEKIVIADYFITTTNNSTTSGYYGFYNDRGGLVATYPIHKTIITKVTMGDTNIETEGEY